MARELGRLTFGCLTPLTTGRGSLCSIPRDAELASDTLLVEDESPDEEVDDTDAVSDAGGV